MLLIPREITADIESLLGALEREGFRAVSAHYDDQAFGNYSVDFVGSSIRLCVVRDRSQYRVDGPDAELLKRVGLWRAFDQREEFEEALVNWLRSDTA